MTPAQALAITLRQQAGQDGLSNKYIALLDDLLAELCVEKLYAFKKPAQKMRENVHVIDAADWPEPDTGFSKLGEL